MLLHLVGDGTFLQFAFAAGIGPFSFSFEGYEIYLVALSLEIAAVHVFVTLFAGAFLHRSEGGSHGMATGQGGGSSSEAVMFDCLAAVAYRWKKRWRLISAFVAFSAKLCAVEVMLVQTYDSNGLRHDPRGIFRCLTCIDRLWICIRGVTAIFFALLLVLKLPPTMISFWAWPLELAEISPSEALARAWNLLLGDTDIALEGMCLLAAVFLVNCSRLLIFEGPGALKSAQMTLAAGALFTAKTWWASFGSCPVSFEASLAAMAVVIVRIVPADAAEASEIGQCRARWTMLLRFDSELFGLHCLMDQDDGVQFLKYGCASSLADMTKAFTPCVCWHEEIRGLQLFCVCVLQVLIIERRVGGCRHSAENLADAVRDVGSGALAKGNYSPLELNVVSEASFPLVLGAGVPLLLKAVSCGTDPDEWNHNLGAPCGKLLSPSLGACGFLDSASESIAVVQCERLQVHRFLSPAHCWRSAIWIHLGVSGFVCRCFSFLDGAKDIVSVEDAYYFELSSSFWWIWEGQRQRIWTLSPGQGGSRSFLLLWELWWTSAMLPIFESKIDKLDVAGCSKRGLLRAGEASCPGPRRRNAPVRIGALSDV